MAAEHPGSIRCRDSGMTIACLLVTHLRAKLEMQRQPHLRDRAVLIVDRSGSRPLVVDHFPAASGATAGMTLEQALSRQTGGVVLEADEAAYRRAFHRILVSLQGVSDRVEGAELGTAYVGLDGLEALYGGEARLVTTLLNAVSQTLAPRAGVEGTKFAAYVAARCGQPMGAAKVPTDVAGFLAPRPVDLLPIPARLRAEMHRFGLLTLGDVAAMEEADHPQSPVEEATLALSNLTGESGTQLSLPSDLRGDRERRLAEAERQLQARTGGKPALYRVVPVAPWHPAPEMRAMQVPLDTSGAGGMKALSLPSPVAVREGPEGEPAAVRLGNRWQRIARIEDRWCFDLWWMPQPLGRTYYRVAREDGGEVTLFRDQRENRWFRQDP